MTAETVVVAAGANDAVAELEPVEDDGTLILIRMATEHPAIQGFLDVLDEELPKAAKMFRIAEPFLHHLDVAQADTFLDAEKSLRRTLDLFQQRLEVIDSINLQSLDQKAQAETKMARKDLIRFVQGAQDRIERACTRLAPIVKNAKLGVVTAVAPPRKHGWGPVAETDSLHDKYKEVFEKQAAEAASTRDEQDKQKLDAEAKLREREQRNKSKPQPIVVKFQGKGANPPPSDNLYVKGLPGNIAEEDVDSIFCEFGTVCSIKLLTADWGSTAFVRMASKRLAQECIDELHDTVPWLFLERWKREIEEKERKETKDLQSLRGAERLAQGKPIVFSLAQSLGIFFNDDLVVQDAAEGSQARSLGVVIGSRVRSVSKLPVKTVQELVGKIQAMKADGLEEAAIAFTPPVLVARFEERPFGFSVGLNEDLGLYVVDKVGELASAKGLQPGLALTKIQERAVEESMPKEDVIALLKEADLPVDIVFEEVLGTDTSTGKSGGKTPPGRKQLAIGKPVIVDLGQPLGVFFNDELVVQDTAEGSQAKALEIANGSRARTVGGEPVCAVQELVAKFQALKADGRQRTEIVFTPPAVVAQFAERPFGFSVGLDEDLGLFVLDQVSDLAAEKGLRSGLALSKVETHIIEDGFSQEQVIELLKGATLPAEIVFEEVPPLDTSRDPPEVEEVNNSDRSSSPVREGKGKGRGRGRGKGKGKGRGGEEAGGDNSTATGVNEALLRKFEQMQDGNTSEFPGAKKPRVSKLDKGEVTLDEVLREIDDLKRRIKKREETLPPPGEAIAKLDQVAKDFRTKTQSERENMTEFLGPAVEAVLTGLEVAAYASSAMLRPQVVLRSVLADARKLPSVSTFEEVLELSGNVAGLLKTL